LLYQDRLFVLGSLVTGRFPLGESPKYMKERLEKFGQENSKDGLVSESLFHFLVKMYNAKEI
jgi:hypothetical protein